MAKISFLYTNISVPFASIIGGTLNADEENEADKKKEKRKKQLAKNHQDRTEIRKISVPIDINKMKLPELKDLAESMGIDIENNEPGEGKGRGHKKTKTMKQLIDEINAKKTFTKPKKTEEQPQYVFSTISSKKK
jgi:hypothetical protein